MSDLRGFVKIHRKIMASLLWKAGGGDDFKLAFAIVMLARWKPGEHLPWRGDPAWVRRGELVTTVSSLVAASGLSTRQVRRAIKFLEKADFLTSTTTNNFTRIKVMKYSTYQDLVEAGGQARGQTHLPSQHHPMGNETAPYKESLRRVKKYVPAARGERPAATAGRVPSGAPKRQTATANGIPREAVEKVLGAYLRLSGVDGTQAARDPKIRADWARQARRLLSRLGGRADLAVECLQDKARQWQGLEWGLAGVANKAGDWLARKQAGAKR